MPTVAEVVRRYGPAYLERFGDRMPASHRKALRVIPACRTGELGTVLYRCEDCGRMHAVGRSCGDRHCPSCRQDRPIRAAMARHHIKDAIVVVERTGRCRSPSGGPARPGSRSTSSTPTPPSGIGSPADPGNKTDDTDLSAIHLAAVNGFGLAEHEPEPDLRPTPTAGQAPARVGAERSVTLQQQMLKHLQVWHVRILQVRRRRLQFPRRPSGRPGSSARPRRSSMPARPA